MSFNIPLGSVQDFPHGAAQHGGWYCRACGNPINAGDQIFKPAGVWICEPCFTSGRHTAQPKQHQQASWAPGPGQTGQQGTRDQQKPPPQQQTASDIQTVDEENWIEIVFDIIPDRHLKRVYASLSKVYHPDIGGDEETQRRINDAYAARGLK